MAGEEKEVVLVENGINSLSPLKDVIHSLRYNGRTIIIFPQTNFFVGLVLWCLRTLLAQIL
jgi:hypothetical protein